MGWECFCVVGFDLGPLLQGGTRILHLQYFFKYVLTYFLHLNSYLVTFLHNTICRPQLFCPFLLSASEFLSNMLFNYHLLHFCTALSLIIMLSSHYHLHKSKNSQSADTVPVHGHFPLVYFPYLCGCSITCSYISGQFNRQQNRLLCNNMVLNILMADPLTIFGHCYFIYICVIYSSST